MSAGDVAPLTELSLSPPSWSVGNWSSCSRTCGGGTQSRPVQCTRRANSVSERVAASLCPQPVPSSRQTCHSQSCPPAWSTGPWAEVSGTGSHGGTAGPPWAGGRAGFSDTCRACGGIPPPLVRSDGLLAGFCPFLPGQCSRTCGKGWRKRSVACKSTSPSARALLLPDAACGVEPKPRTHEDCLLKRCHKHKKLQWLVSAWSQVRAPGPGRRRALPVLVP